MNTTPYCHPAGPDPNCAICARCAVDEAFKAAVLSVPHVKAGAKATNRVLIPEPPAFPPGTRDTAVVTVAAGAIGEKLLEISEPGLRAYADRLGADFVVSRWLVPQWPVGSKFALSRILDVYDRVVYIDADVVVPKNAPDLLAEVPYDKIGAYNDLPQFLGFAPELAVEFKKTREALGLPITPVPYYLNTGVMVFSRAHRDVFIRPDRPVPPFHCAEQHWWIGRMLQLGAPVHFLPRVFNWQWWDENGFDHAPPNAIRHYSGMQHKKTLDERLRLMAKDAGVARPSRFAMICVDEGDKIPGQPCGSTLRRCNKFGDITTRFVPCKGADRCCKTCDEFRAI